MRGVNSTVQSGNVGSRISYGVTDEGVPAVSFDIAVEEKSTRTWVRVNAFGGLVEICRDRLREGGYVQVVGRLMNRKRRTEIRAEQIVFGGGPTGRSGS